MNIKSDVILVRLVFQDDGTGDPYRYAMLFTVNKDYIGSATKVLEDAYAEWNKLTDIERMDFEDVGIENIYSFVENRLDGFNEQFPEANCSFIDYEDVIL